jgi:hypothetical protein
MLQDNYVGDKWENIFKEVEAWNPGKSKKHWGWNYQWRNGEYKTKAWIKSPCGVTLRTYDQLRAFVLWVKTAREEEKVKALKEREGEMDDEDSDEESSDTTSQL